MHTRRLGAAYNKSCAAIAARDYIYVTSVLSGSSTRPARRSSHLASAEGALWVVICQRRSSHR
jgi:hypothetical protein